MRVKMAKQTPPAPTASAGGPCPTISQIRRTPQHLKFTQHHRTTQPPPVLMPLYKKKTNIPRLSDLRFSVLFNRISVIKTMDR